MPTIFCLLIIFCIWLTYERKKLTKQQEEIQETFLKTEKKAAIARKKDISTLDYITIPMESLPLQKGTDDTINEYIDELAVLNNLPIVNLSNFSNTELKLQYGAANFERLSEYDENYFSLIQLLANFGVALYERDKQKEARQVLEYALSIGSDLRVSLYTLAKIYAEQENESGIHSLQAHIIKQYPEKSESMLLELEKIRCHQYFA